MGEFRDIDDRFDAVVIRTRVGLAFALPGGSAREVHVMCADGPESAVRTQLASLPDGTTGLFLDAEVPVDSCVVTVPAEGSGILDHTEGPLTLSTHQAVRLGTVDANSVVLHTSAAGSFRVDAITARDATLDARSTSRIEVDQVTAELLGVRTDGTANTSVHAAEVGVWEVVASAHAEQTGSGAAGHVAIHARGAARVDLTEVRADTAEVDLGGSTEVWLGVSPDDTDATVDGDATLTLTP